MLGSMPNIKTALASQLHFISLPILGGPMRGTFWTLSSRGKLSRIFLGSYEKRQTEIFCRYVHPGDVVFDVGANVGYYSLLAAHLAGPEGLVLAFEPAPSNAFHLRKHVERNRLDNVAVYEAAVGDEDGVVRFTTQQCSGTGTAHVAADGELVVQMYRVDDIVVEQHLFPSLIKIDVEGAELKVLAGARRTLAQIRPTLLLSTHSKPLHQSCIDFLAPLGYHVAPIDGDVVEQSHELLFTAGRGAIRRAA